MRILDRNVTYGTRISDNKWKDNNGQLICNNCILARTGAYKYRESEIIPNGDFNKIVEVYRDEADVFDPKSMASFENKPLCNDHPKDDVCTTNYKKLQYGYLRDVRRGTGEDSDCLVGTLVVLDPEIIGLILSGEKRDLSLGYDTEIIQGPDGKYYMKNIRGNHIALVDSGRAGCATIRDRNNIDNNLGGHGMKNRSKATKMSPELLKRLRDASDEEIIEVEEQLDENGDSVLVEKEPCECAEIEVEELEDDDNIEEFSTGEPAVGGGLEAKVDTIIDLLTQLVGKFDIVPDTDMDIDVEDDEPIVEEIPEEDVVEEIPVEEPVVTEDAGKVVEVKTTIEVKEPGEAVAEEVAGDVVEEAVEEAVDSNESILYDADEDITIDDGCDEDDDVALSDAGISPYARLVKNHDSAMPEAPTFQNAWQERFDKKLKEQR